jgi:hypothetical protein
VSSQKQKNRNPHRMLIESLENRQLMSANAGIGYAPPASQEVAEPAAFLAGRLPLSRETAAAMVLPAETEPHGATLAVRRRAAANLRGTVDVRIPGSMTITERFGRLDLPLFDQAGSRLNYSLRSTPDSTSASIQLLPPAADDQACAAVYPSDCSSPDAWTLIVRPDSSFTGSFQVEVTAELARHMRRTSTLTAAFDTAIAELLSDRGKVRVSRTAVAAKSAIINVHVPHRIGANLPTSPVEFPGGNNEEPSMPSSSRLESMSTEQLITEFDRMLGPNFSVKLADSVVEDILDELLKKEEIDRVGRSRKFGLTNYRTDLTDGGIVVEFDYRIASRGWTTDPFGGAIYTPWVSESGSARFKIDVEIKAGMVEASVDYGSVDWKSNNHLTNELARHFSVERPIELAIAMNAQSSLQTSLSGNNSVYELLINAGADSTLSELTGDPVDKVQRLLDRAASQIHGYVTEDGIRFTFGSPDRFSAGDLAVVNSFISAGTVALRTSNGHFVVAEDGGGRQVNADRNAAGSWETFSVVDLGGGKVALRTASGHYLTAEHGGGREIVADRSSIGAWESFRVVGLAPGKVALRTESGDYVTAEHGGGDVVVATRKILGSWETFEFLPNAVENASRSRDTERAFISAGRVGLQASNGQFVVAEGGGGSIVNANRDLPGPWEHFKVVDLGYGIVALQTGNGNYLTAEHGGGREVVANRSEIGAWERFEVIGIDSNRVGLRAHNGQYVAAVHGGGGVLVADRNNLGSWETFRFSANPEELIPEKVAAARDFISAGQVTLRTSGGYYVVAEHGGGREVAADRRSGGAWETFTVVNMGGGRVALRAANGQYLCAEGGGGGAVVANRDGAGAWETFRVVGVGHRRIGLQAANGQFLVAEHGGGSIVNANRDSLGGWETFVF